MKKFLLFLLFLTLCLWPSPVSGDSIEIGATMDTGDTVVFYTHTLDWVWLPEWGIRIGTIGGAESLGIRQRHSGERWYLDLGGAVTAQSDRLGGHWQFGTSVGYKLSESFSVRFTHWSNAGTADPNLGENVLAIEYEW